MTYRIRARDVLTFLIVGPIMAVWTKANLEGINILDNPINAAVLPVLGMIILFYYRSTQSKAEPIPQ